MDRAHEAAKSESGGTAKEHAGSENGLRHGTEFIGEGIGNHGLGRGSVGGFADANRGTRDKQEDKGRSEPAGDGGEAPKNNAGGNNLRAAEAVSQKPARNTGDGENHEQPGLQGTELRVGQVHLLAEKWKERDDNLAVGEIDKINQSKYSKESNLIGR